MQQHSQKYSIDINEYVKNESITKKFIQDLGEELTYQQVENLVTMSTPLIATILLMHRKGISHDLLIQRVGWLYEEIKARKGELNFSAAPSSAVIQTALNFLSAFVDKKRDIFEPSVSAKKGQKNIMMLAYYRNNLIHLFINEAELACTLLGFNSIEDIQKGVSIDAVWEKVSFLRDILSDEFVLRKTMKTK
jgi:glycerol-3-phosphate O-acyltransferase